MKLVIPIDRSTVRENPHAGRTEFYMAGQRCVTHDDGGNVVSISQPMVRLHSLTPDPSHFFDYVPTSVRCEDCQAEFAHTELLSDGDDDRYSDTVCPKCGSWGCCEVEFERLAT